MKILQELTLTLFSKKTIDAVKKQFREGPEITPVNSFELPVRLFKPNSSNINLEMILYTPTGEEKEENDFAGLGKVRTGNLVMYAKPIGFYRNRAPILFENDEIKVGEGSIELTILNEIEPEYENLLKDNLITSDIKVNKLTLKENAIIAAFSMEAAMKAKKYEDCSLKVNGLDADIYMTFDNEYPQFHLNDKYGLRGGIAAYFLKGEKQSINVAQEYQESFNKLYSMSLLSAFKNIK